MGLKGPILLGLQMEALQIISQSWPIAAMVIGCGLGLGIWHVVNRTTRTDPLDHARDMARIETTHREIMLKINREAPKVIEHKSGGDNRG